MSLFTPLVNIWHRCHGCNAEPILGHFYQCHSCPAGPNNDLCEACYRLFGNGFLKHPSVSDQAPGDRQTSHKFVSVVGKPFDQYVRWLDIPICPATTPTIIKHFVVRPVFCCGRTSFLGTYAFVVRSAHHRTPLVLTALHVIDELSKTMQIDCSTKNTSYTGHELARLITEVSLYDVFASNWMTAKLGTGDSMLVLPNARICTEEPYSQSDIAAFRVNHHAKLGTATLASRAPRVGDPIWLLVRPSGNTAAPTKQAVVVEATTETLIFRFRSFEKSLNHTSGAPLVNASGEVVGINIGGGVFQSHRFGHACHVETIHRHLEAF